MKRICSILLLVFCATHFLYAQTEQENKIYDVVEIRPEFSGGEAARLTFFAENIIYPQNAINSGIQGTIFVSFIVEKDGSISNIVVVRGLGGGLSEEAVRVIKAMPKWIPGSLDGHPIRVQFFMPLRFALR